MIFPLLVFDKGAQEDLPAVEIITELTMKKHFLWTVLSLCPLPCKICFFPTHIFPPPSYFFVFPCRYFWDFKTQILKHLHENTSCTLCADIFNTYTVNYKCKCIHSNIISNDVVQSMFTWRDSSVWSLGYHGSIMFSVSLSYSFYVKMISD